MFSLNSIATLHVNDLSKETGVESGLAVSPSPFSPSSLCGLEQIVSVGWCTLTLR